MKQIIFILAVFFTSISIQAQYGGVDRSIGGPGQFQQSKNKEKKSEFDFVQASTDKMAKELSLDDFQKAAAKNIIEDYKNQVISISAEEIPDTGKNEKINVVKDKMEAKIKQLLNKDQLVKFEAMKNKSEKKGKGKKNDNDAEKTQD
ncbi:hypothetical protein [Flavobacterium pallidum]|uniref:DUF4890 domain-containing protein n=1 Tax=Flavobacterium pallidum TaxID=2172098 RepID=A0A2S1SHW2_9FLAO|nr:hypothetical protein [Flavobacterium pallidum]AWI25932.1 hypothetical protein HYN49_08480 [Flavobacterium pallidum]